MMSIFEMGMLLCFGAAWPLNIYKSLKSRTTAGRSILFQWAIIIGYICGIIGKVMSPACKWKLIFDSKSWFINKPLLKSVCFLSIETTS